jgi:hypothetical protein
MTGSILIGVLTETKCIMKHLFCIIYFVVFFLFYQKCLGLCSKYFLPSSSTSLINLFVK